MHPRPMADTSRLASFRCFIRYPAFRLEMTQVGSHQPLPAVFRPTPMRTSVRMYRPADEAIEAAPRPPRDRAELPIEHLEAELCALASHLAAGMARWIALID